MSGRRDRAERQQGAPMRTAAQAGTQPRAAEGSRPAGGDASLSPWLRHQAALCAAVTTDTSSFLPTQVKKITRYTLCVRRGI